jgi:hypothetical protein
MRLIIWEDRNGWSRASWIRDEDPDSSAPQGIPAGPPNLDLLDLEEVKRDINNALVKQQIFTWADVQRRQNAISGVARAALVGKIVQLYKMEDANE